MNVKDTISPKKTKSEGDDLYESKYGNLTVTVREDFIPRGTRWQCTAKTFYYGVFDAYRLNGGSQN